MGEEEGGSEWGLKGQDDDGGREERREVQGGKTTGRGGLT